MTRQQMSILIIAGLILLIAVATLLVRCPWSDCRYLNLNTHTITTLQEYLDFVSDESASRQLIASPQFQMR